MFALCLVLVTAADGVVRGLDAKFPALYRHSASLGIAISQVAHGTSGFVGLTEVAQALERGGIALIPNEPTRLLDLARNPKLADEALRSAAELQVLDRTQTFVLHGNETGMIDFYALALRLFGYHVQGFYWLFFALLATLTVCFVVSFRDRPVLIVPCLLWLLLLLVAVHELDPADIGAGAGTPASARFLPMLSILAVIFVTTLAISGNSVSARDLATTALAAGVFAVCANARSFALWQLCAVVGLLAAGITARALLAVRKYRSHFANLALWPLALFVLLAVGLISLHHVRRDNQAYSAATRIGHPFWPSYLSATLQAFSSELPELERQSGVNIGTNPDAYVGARLRVEVRKRGETLDKYVDANGWINAAREGLARAIVFDLWKRSPLRMLETYGRAVVDAVALVAEKLAWLAACVATLPLVALAGHPLIWAIWGLFFVWLGGASALINVLALGLLLLMPAAARRCAAEMLPSLSLIALFGMTTILVMPVVRPDTIDYPYFTWFVLLMCLWAKLDVIGLGKRLRRRMGLT